MEAGTGVESEAEAEAEAGVETETWEAAATESAGMGDSARSNAARPGENFMSPQPAGAAYWAESPTTAIWKSFRRGR